jgi:hypothetical protein
MWCGLDDPMTTRVTALESDTSTDAVVLLHKAIYEAMQDGYANGVTTSQLILMSNMSIDDEPRYPAIHEAVSMLCGGRPNSKALGRQIQLYKNRWLGQRSIVIEKDSHTKTNLIRLRGVDVASVVESEVF